MSIGYQARSYVARLGSKAALPVVGALAGGYGGHKLSKHQQKKHPSSFKSQGPGDYGPAVKRPLGHAANVYLGAFFGAMSGHHVAEGLHARTLGKGFRDAARRAARGGSGPKNSNPPPSWAKGHKTKAEAAAEFKRRARASHPDLHPNDKNMEEQFKKTNQEWQDFKNSEHYEKLAAAVTKLMKYVAPKGAEQAANAASKGTKKSFFWKHFRKHKLRAALAHIDGMEDVASHAAGGALVGAGSNASNDSVKRKTLKKDLLHGAAGGALVGGAVGGARAFLQTQLKRAIRHQDLAGERKRYRNLHQELKIVQENKAATAAKNAAEAAEARKNKKIHIPTPNIADDTNERMLNRTIELTRETRKKSVKFPFKKKKK